MATLSVWCTFLHGRGRQGLRPRSLLPLPPPAPPSTPPTPTPTRPNPAHWRILLLWQRARVAFGGWAHLRIIVLVDKKASLAHVVARASIAVQVVDLAKRHPLVLRVDYGGRELLILLRAIAGCCERQRRK